MNNRRRYGHCAKCGSTKTLDTNYVGVCCHGTPGYYTHCAVDGAPMGPATRDYVCLTHLAVPVAC